MKKLLLVFVVIFLSFTVVGQQKNVDTSEMCIPYVVAQKMLLELTDYDRLKEISVLDKKEIVELNNKITFLDKINNTWVEKDSLNNEILVKTEEKVEIYKVDNENLRKENKKLKTKNTLIKIISGAIIVPLTYISIFK
jgi:2-methylcitrate dehydratase PrpD